MPDLHRMQIERRCLNGRAVHMDVYTCHQMAWLEKCLRSLLCAAVLFAAVFGTASASAETSPEIHLVFSNNVALKQPSENELAAIFLGRTRQWSDGTRVKIAILESSEAQRLLLGVVANRSPSQYWAHWRNIVFSGRGIMPKLFSSEEELLQYIAAEEGAVGHLARPEKSGRYGLSTLTIKGAKKP
ncbi:MAG: hypothetical protein Hals2KO_20950 [Halioglobus sp.]